MFLRASSPARNDDVPTLDQKMMSMVLFSDADLGVADYYGGLWAYFAQNG